MTRSARRCRVCGEGVPPRDDNPAYPLCSDRCRLVDLGRWFDEDYVISKPLFAGGTDTPGSNGGGPESAE